MTKNLAALLLLAIALAGCVSSNPQPPAAQEAPDNNAASDNIQDRNTESVAQ